MNKNNPFLALYEAKLREFEAIHAQWMSESLFTEKGKRLKKQKNKIMAEYDLARKAWDLYDRWSRALNDKRSNDAHELEKELNVLMHNNRYFLKTVKDIAEQFAEQLKSNKL